MAAAAELDAASGGALSRAELDVASGGALSRAEASPAAADMTSVEGPAMLRTPAMLNATARRARERAPGNAGWTVFR
jgi:hypothetical protein